ncbi:ATP-binding protein [Neptunitalea lumnitzerae]|uniref:ATP-binding protein n=1 Tax=Neptunitalea lumnitzerae TaxID=2965509 RepID=UPI002490BB67|nr:ATP-binding protein [Neptunitalea sp. Y10]
MSFLCFLVLVIIGFIIIRQEHIIAEENEKLEMQKMLNVVERNIEQILQNSYVTTLSLSQAVDNNGQVHDFESIAKQLLNKNKNIDVVQLVPDGVIKYIYPLEGNEAALGLNLFTTAHTKHEAEQTIERNDIYFAGPLELVQGGRAVVGRLPIYKNDKFWGFSAVIVSFKNILENSGLSNFNINGYSVQLSKINPVTQKVDYFLDGPTNLENSIKETIKLSQGNWQLHLVKEKKYTILKSLYPTIILWAIFCVGSTILLYYLIKHPSELQKVIINQDQLISKNEIELQAIFDNAALGIAVVDIEKRIFIKANHQLCKMLECKLDYLEHNKVHNFVQDKDDQHFENLLLKLKKGDLNKFSATKKLISKNNTIVWVNIAVSPMWHKGEKPTSYISVIEDITEKRRSSDLLKESESRFKSLFDDSTVPLTEEDFSEVKKELEKAQITHLPSTKIYRYLKAHPDLIAQCVCKTNIIAANKEMVGLFEATCKLELIEHFKKLATTKGPHFLIKLLVTICKGEVSFSGETEIETLKGNKKEVLIKWYVVPGFEKSYKRVFVSTEDITERKNVVRELKKSHNTLIERNKRLLDFSYIISHNLRSHTSNIQTIITNLEYVESQEEQNELLDLLKNVSNSLDETIHNLNEITSIRTNVNITTELLDVHEYTEKTISVLKSKIQKEGAIVINKIKPETRILYNPAYLESILLNLISNALKYKHQDRTPEITIYTETFNGNLRLTVQDNGIGIDLKKHGDKIFGMYKTFTKRPDSKGIGLYITKNQIEVMGGHIEVQSEVNVGSIFKVFFNEC